MSHDRRVLEAIADRIPRGQTGTLYLHELCGFAGLTMIETKAAVRRLRQREWITQHPAGVRRGPSVAPPGWKVKVPPPHAPLDPTEQPIKSVTDKGWTGLERWRGGC